MLHFIRDDLVKRSLAVAFVALFGLALAACDEGPAQPPQTGDAGPTMNAPDDGLALDQGGDDLPRSTE